MPCEQLTATANNGDDMNYRVTTNAAVSLCSVRPSNPGAVADELRLISMTLPMKYSAQAAQS